MKGQKITIIFAILWFSLGASCLAATYQVITGPQNPESKIDARDLQKIYLGEKTSWPGGGQIKVVALKGGEAHKNFLREIVKMNPMKFSIHWKRKVFTGAGTGTHIKFFKNDEKVKEYIAANPGAIGYVSPASLDDTVKKLEIIHED